MEIINELRNQVVELDKGICRKLNNIALITLEIGVTQSQLEQLWTHMNICDRYLAGWFCGHKGKVFRYRELKKSLALYKQTIKDLEHGVDELGIQVLKVIDEYLRANDYRYQLLIQSYKTVVAMKNTIEVFIADLNYALLAIGNAQIFDHSSYQQAISWNSSMWSYNASDAIRIVCESATPLQNALEEYNGFRLSHQFSPIELKLDDNLDLMNDFPLLTLYGVEYKLEKVLMKVNEIHHKVSDHFDMVSKDVLDYALKVRSECNC